MMQRLQIKEEWANVLEDGTIGNLVHTVSESEAEIARYMEYLFLEKKWKTARNISSLTHLADLISRKRELARSAIGFILVAHTDPEGRNRLVNYGSVFFDIDEQSDWDNLVKDPEATFTQRNALTPWMCSDPYIIPRNTIFKSSSGTQFVSLETVASRQLTEPWINIKNNEAKYYDFIKAGGWSGIKYLKIPVIQGEPVYVFLGNAKGTRFESFVIDSPSVEAGANTVSEEFFNVFVSPNLPGLENYKEEWVRVENIRLAGPYDKVYEVKYLTNSDRILIKFGDGITGRLLPQGARLDIEYLETKGEAGNIIERFQINSMILPDGMSQVDPRINKQVEFLSCTNISPVMGGKDVEVEENFKVNAPPSYLVSYSTSTLEAYLQQIQKRAPVSLAHIKIFQTQVMENDSFGSDNNSAEFSSSILQMVMQEISKAKNAITICAIRANGTKFDDPESELIQPIIKSLADKKSPADTFQYLEPNFINLRPNIIISTKDNIPEVEVYQKLKDDILNTYSVFRTDFEESYYTSKIIDIAKDAPYAESASVFIEAKANVQEVPEILLHSDAGNNITEWINSDIYVGFKFQFDKIFAKNKEKAGFKNFRYNSPYVIRADLRFAENPAKDTTFLLLDNRIDTTEKLNLLEAESHSIKEGPSPRPTDFMFDGFGVYRVFDEYDDSFQNRQCRTAQFPFIEKITSDSYCLRMKLFNIEPFEVRPLEVDDNGIKKVMKVANVGGDKRVSITLQGAVTGDTCFQRNEDYYENAKIIFYENYLEPDNPQYAMGYLVVPINKILVETDFKEIETQMINNGTTENKEEFGRLLKQKLLGRTRVDVWARPVLEDFETLYPNDIIFTDKDDVKVEKRMIVKD